MDKKLFSKRLTEQRIKAGYKNQTQFARAYEARYPAERRDEAGGNEGDFKGIFGTVKHYENENHKGIPSLDKVANMCDLLGCDIDYLAGRIDKQTHDLQFACEFTGLSETAVMHLLEIKAGGFPFSMKTVNALFEADTVIHFLASMQRVADCYHQTEKKLKELPSKVRQAINTGGPTGYIDLCNLYDGTGNESLASLRRAWYSTLYEFSLMAQEFFAPLPTQIEEELSQCEKTVSETKDRLLAEWKREREGNDGEGHAQG